MDNLVYKIGHQYSSLSLLLKVLLMIVGII